RWPPARFWLTLVCGAMQPASGRPASPRVSSAPSTRRTPLSTIAAMTDALTGQTVELLQQLIRNRCVNDGTVMSGQEVRNSETLRSYLEGSGLEVEVYQPAHAPGRTSLVARIEGRDPKAPTLCLMGHTDVVPVNPKTWTHDPFGGELIDGEVWGRGAIDM